MGRTIVFLSLLAAVFYPVAGRAASCTAATCDVITITQVGDATNTFTFTVPDAPTPYAYDTDPSNPYFELTDVPVTGPGGYSSLDTIFFYPSNAVPSGGLWDEFGLTGTGETGSSYWGLYVDGIVLFNGTVDAPTFQAGTSGGPLGNDDYGGPEMYDYSIEAYSPPEIPEPSPLILLGTGAMGLFSAYRRRRSA